MTVLQRTDLALSIELLTSKTGFIGKLHGSRSQIESCIFSSSDYATLINDESYLQVLTQLFTSASIVFIGYGVRDEYVLELLGKSERAMSIFGTGPHFVVTTQSVSHFPNLHRISYSLARYPDHRAAMSVLDYIWQAHRLVEDSASVAISSPTKPLAFQKHEEPTAYFISDLKPAGKWSTSQSVTADGGGGVEIEATLGLGFSDDEIPIRTTTAPHDFLVGLTCFDYVFLPLSALAATHELLGSERFWRLVESDVLRFVHTEQEIAAIYPKGEIFGDVGLIVPRDEGGVEPQQPREVIRRHLTAAPGKEREAEGNLATLESKVVTFREAIELELASLVRGATMMPFVAKLLGIGEAIVPSQVPKWLMFGYLRMAHLVQTGAICDRFGLQAAKIPFGGLHLTSAAFSIQPASDAAEQYASFAISGRYGSDLGSVFQQPAIINAVLAFRESQEGIQFRVEVRDKLRRETGSEFQASVNAGLERNIPPVVLQKARDKFSILMSADARSTTTPAVWSTAFQLDDSTRWWRAKFRKNLLALCKDRNIAKSDPCICGSGDKLNLCCLHPLKE